MRLASALLLFALLGAALGAPARARGPFATSQHRFCGRKLVSVLQKLCQHNLSSNPYQVRVSTGRRSKRGIVERCCKRVCSRRTLLRYCAPPSPPTFLLGPSPAP